MNMIRHRGLPRPVEISLAIVGLAAVAPALAVFAVLIRLNSRGPVLFRQDRVGLNGDSFILYKLRTMTVTGVGLKITAADDDRITSLGKILRRYKIDELPELWNVLKGDMAIVGPRPEVPELVDLNDPSWQQILHHRPGITDPVTLRLRNEEQLLAQVGDKERYYREVVQPYKKRGYLNFVNNKSWKTDVRLIGRTLKAIAFPQTVKQPTRDELQWSLAD